MCMKNRTQCPIWQKCPKDFNYNSVLTYAKIFDKEPKACRFEDIEEFKSPFALKKVTPPGWIEYDNQILRFYGYYQEPIPESPLENYRVHHVKILYYLADDTICVVEPSTFDPGFPQGKLINRHKIPLGCTGAFVTLDHLNVGCEVELYSKKFLICGCDNFTRRFLNRRGTTVPLNMSMPCDLATENRKSTYLQIAKKASVQGCRIVEKGTQFFNNTRKILRFWAYWDDRCSYKGRLRKFTFLYYLEDHTIEITEILDGHDGDTNPAFFRRQRLLKNFGELVHLPGFTDEGFDVLNLSPILDECGVGLANSYVTDRLYSGYVPREFYLDSDLSIGATINVYGRAFILTEADPFTQSYYRDKYGVQDFTPLVLNEPCDCQCTPTPPCRVPELEENSFENWGKDSRNLVMAKDVLVFSALLSCPLQRVNTERRFTIKFYVLDSSVEIFEHSHPNSGFPRGVFLGRTRVKKPRILQNNSSCTHSHSVYYQPADMYIGNTLELNGFQFTLMGAEECTLSFMEHNYGIFPQSNICCILNKVREAFGPLVSGDVLAAFSANDSEKKGVMSASQFRCLILDLTKRSLNEHEVGTLIRAYRVMHPPAKPDMETLQSILHTELKKYCYDQTLLKRLEYSFRQYDPCRSGSIEREVVSQVLKGAKIPVRKELIDFLVDSFPASETCCKLNYCELMRFLDWEAYEIPEAKPAAVACIMRHLCPRPPPVIDCLNYRAFLEDVCPNFKCELANVCCPCPQGEYAARTGCYEAEEPQSKGMQESNAFEGSPQCEGEGRTEVQPESQETNRNGGENGDEGLHEFFEN